MGSTITMKFDKNLQYERIFCKHFSQEVAVTCMLKKASVQCENIQVVTKTYFYLHETKEVVRNPFTKFSS